MKGSELGHKKVDKEERGNVVIFLIKILIKS